MSDTGNSGSPSRGLLPTLRLFVGAGAVEMRMVALAANSLTIGRRPYNDLQLDDLTVSGEHALLRVRDGEWAIHDLDSRNGTLVNGRPVRHQALVDGDVVDIGIYRLRYEAAREGAGASTGASSGASMGTSTEAATIGAAATAGTQAGDAAGTQAGDAVGSGGGEASSDPDSSPSSDPAAVPASAADSVAGADAVHPGGPLESGEGAGDLAAELDALSPAHVVHLSGAQAGHVQSLDRAINRVGGLAGQVAVISRRKGGYYITHLEGLTFPQVNGELIGLTAHRLVDGDLVELAGTMLRFQL